MRRTRSGATLTETLVVLGIIGLMVALLMPAIQYLRESSRRMHCQNNLRQIALAIQNHDSAKSELPSLYGGTFLKRPFTIWDEFHFHSWRTMLLPQLEQDPLFQQIDQSLPATVAAQQPALNTKLGVFTCPSTSNINRTVPDIFEFNDGQVPLKTVGTAARSDYEAIIGLTTPAKPPAVNSVDLRGLHFGAWGIIAYDIATVQGRYRPGRLRDISDGLSHTILVAERAGRPDKYVRGAPVDPYPYVQPSMGMDHHQAAWGVSTHFQWITMWLGQRINDTNAQGVFSFHSGGANLALADGSVRFVPETIAQETLQALVTRSRGDTAHLD